ncbi:MAG TPA: hypothetical protein DCZ88_06155 [Pseudanabaena sp.]|nr:hypothetical protein [Pseudanabaena sp.]
MRIYYLAGVILSITTILSACGEGTPTECTISTARELKQGITKTGKFAPGTDCEAMRKLAEEGKPLPTIADATTTNTAPKAAVTPAQEAFKTPFIAGQKNQDLIPTTDKKSRIQELEKKIGTDSKQVRDPFTSTVINPVPKLEALLAKLPKEPPNLRKAIVVKTSQLKKIVPPDTKAAEGTVVTGTVEIGGAIYAIIQATDEPTPRNVRAGQLISNGRVLVKRIDTNSEPPIVVLQQNGVEVLRAVGAPVVASSTDTNTNQSPSP